MPRPRLVCVLALLDEYERMGKGERKSEFPKFDGRLRDAVTDDRLDFRKAFGIERKMTPCARRRSRASRCKQAGMHWRHHNAACVCAIIARLRSAA